MLRDLIPAQEFVIQMIRHSQNTSPANKQSNLEQKSQNLTWQCQTSKHDRYLLISVKHFQTVEYSRQWISNILLQSLLHYRPIFIVLGCLRILAIIRLGGYGFAGKRILIILI